MHDEFIFVFHLIFCNCNVNPGNPPNCLIKLPNSFVELYSIVNRVKGRDSRSDDMDDDGGAETAICLLTGTVMRSGTIRRLKEVSASTSALCRASYIGHSFHGAAFESACVDSPPWHLHPSRKEGRIWDWNIFPRSKMHRALDA